MTRTIKARDSVHTGQKYLWRVRMAFRITGRPFSLASTELIQWTLRNEEFDEMTSTNKEAAPGPDGHPKNVYRCARSIGSQIFQCIQTSCGGGVSSLFAASKTVIIPNSSTVDDQGRIVRSPDPLRPFTLCHCDCKIHTTEVCSGLQQYSVSCINPAQRCVSTKQMTDNMFEIETSALAQCTRMPPDSGILLTDAACACPSVNHWWIFWVLDKASLPAFLQSFLRTIYHDCTNAVTHTDKVRGHFAMARDVKQVCPANGFFTVTFDPIFRCLHDAAFPKDPSLPACLQPTQCAFADDFAVAAPSFRTLMPGVTPAYRIIDRVTTMNLNCKKSYWVQHGNDT